MVDIRITYETLFDLLRREKNREELQRLDKDFYEQVLAYLKEKKEAITKKGDELFASAEREKLKIQFQNIRRIIKELYERREKKIINIAMSKARTGSDVIDTSSLLPSEKEFFEEQVALFEKYKKRILDAILELRQLDEEAGIRLQDKIDAESEKNKLELRKEPLQEQDKSFNNARELEGAEESEEKQSKRVEENLPETLNLDEPGFATANELEDAVKSAEPFVQETKRVRILSHIPGFMGRDGSPLGPFEEGDEVELDTSIAELLIKRGGAEPSEP